jgi:hypothetical protein
MNEEDLQAIVQSAVLRAFLAVIGGMVAGAVTVVIVSLLLGGVK